MITRKASRADGFRRENKDKYVCYVIAKCCLKEFRPSSPDTVSGRDDSRNLEIPKLSKMLSTIIE